MAQGHWSGDFRCSKALPKDLCTPVTLSRCKSAFCWVRFNFASQPRPGRLKRIIMDEDLKQQMRPFWKSDANAIFFLQGPRKQPLEIAIFKVYRAAQPTHIPRPTAFESSRSWRVIPKGAGIWDGRWEHVTECLVHVEQSSELGIECQPGRLMKWQACSVHVTVGTSCDSLSVVISRCEHLPTVALLPKAVTWLGAIVPCCPPPPPPPLVPRSYLSTPHVCIHWGKGTWKLGWK